jgi:hypothetical protein
MVSLTSLGTKYIGMFSSLLGVVAVKVINNLLLFSYKAMGAEPGKWEQGCRPDRDVRTYYTVHLYRKRVCYYLRRKKFFSLLPFLTSNSMIVDMGIYEESFYVQVC